MMKQFCPTQNHMAYETKYAGLNLKTLTSEGSFEGYASVFGQEDLSRDVVLPGAFRDSLRKSGISRVKMLFQHDPAEPVGLWREIREDAKGLYVRGQLMTQVSRAREILSLIRARALDGLSIGFRVLEGRRDTKTGIRRLKKVDLWEISIVTFPMLNNARIHAVKAYQDKWPRHAPTFLEKRNENRLITTIRRASNMLRLEH
ncbi:MAG: HK97 family phage prohead protease [Pseudomonadota bacterium]